MKRNVKIMCFFCLFVHNNNLYKMVHKEFAEGNEEIL